MKRSHRVALVLLGGASVGAFSGCSPSEFDKKVRITSQSVYVNDYFVPGVGYYHAPFHQFFQYKYNYYDYGRRLYFYGGQWGPFPYQSPINISSPTDAAAGLAETARTDVVRGGFGFTSGGFHTWS